MEKAKINLLLMLLLMEFLASFKTVVKLSFTARLEKI
jgi:hypothetical protein